MICVHFTPADTGGEDISNTNNKVFPILTVWVFCGIGAHALREEGFFINTGRTRQELYGIIADLQDV